MFRFLENHHQGGHIIALFQITSMRSSMSTRNATALRLLIDERAKTPCFYSSSSLVSL
jgi:diphthamide biosynthesis methyltransferase